MSNSHKSSSVDSKREWMRYAGLASQLLVYLSISVFGGIKLDRWLGVFPLLTILFPILVLGAVFYI
ncbi:MAG: AtpZ/AtpI family protein, partial [Chitinophagaceae bacterium]